MSRLKSFISQLDGIVVLLAAAREEVFDLIHLHQLTWFPPTQDPLLPETADAYRIAISNAAFLLGYAYFESFLADIAREVYMRRPSMLPKDRQLSSQELLDAASKDDLVRLIIEKEVRSIFAGSIEDIQKHFQKKLGLRWPDESNVSVASRMRNCLMHNGGIVDARLASSSPLPLGSRILLDPDVVHDFGIAARSFAHELWEDVERKHLGREDG